jgi:hypothetical protein
MVDRLDPDVAEFAATDNGKFLGGLIKQISGRIDHGRLRWRAGEPLEYLVGEIVIHALVTTWPLVRPDPDTPEDDTAAIESRLREQLATQLAALASDAPYAVAAAAYLHAAEITRGGHG